MHNVDGQSCRQESQEDDQDQGLGYIQFGVPTLRLLLLLLLLLLLVRTGGPERDGNRHGQRRESGQDPRRRGQVRHHRAQGRHEDGEDEERDG
ncbi:hypothetical protein BO70DRAFT_110726 [Aspergillus heteromorphus CBS 117.55]|uniref:Uncharacterized protein n=1 Tax=Aspergillus heteromorphus CBS 117.55 TaxID=1448321 RepID=A0A317VP87_9EURO|nr:uncharacterized protein BO70DRAFT_110726 [Aspergillus heteromorphus CBS 117.55]PWY73670.1 hypothetical protein BO70DRAFT_110726 [Aspergillus heteromorphus CBS 117.55]